ncbi:MAG TPA: hypothetical protein VI386_14535 [Candidatus Sulfotelmatobacter sp.]
MKKLPILAFFLLIITTFLRAQDLTKTMYAESFRHGSTHVTEESFEMKLNLDEPTYRELIKDARGNDRFLFTVAPQVLEGGTQVICWQVKLEDLHHGIYENILQISQERSDGAQNNLWRLDPGKYASIPIDTKRIIKVDAFYVTMQVKGHHFTPLDSPYLDSMTVQVDFKNSDPRVAPAK